MKKIIAIILTAMVCVAAVAQDRDTTDVVACAKGGNDVCQNLLGKWIFEGSHGFTQDYEKAVAWWLQAAKQNNDEALVNLGLCYQYGLGVEADSVTAVRLYEKAMRQGNTVVIQMHDSLAREGSVFSAMLLGRCYKLAHGVKRDAFESCRYYKMAAKRGNVEAMREAAILMRNANDDAGALEMFEKAMHKGDITATYYYGKMLMEGRSTERDAKAAVGYLHQAADKGHAAAQFEMAEAYAQGNGVEQDSIEAISWYSMAALGGNRASWWQLAECYREGHGTAIDFEEALEYYAKASEMGYHNKLKGLLGDESSEWNDTPFIYYLRGMRLLEVDNNPDAAMKEFSKLPKQMTMRQTMEAVCMIHPAYSKRNVKKAVKQLQKLAYEDRRAAYELALLQMKGEGMEQDIEKAEKALSTLAYAGYARAIDYLADCYYNGVYVKQNKARANMFYLIAEERQRLSATGASRLAQALRTGDGIKMNAERAAELDKYRAYDVKSVLEKVKIN